MPRRLRVLLVDDDGDLRHVYASVLRDCGLEVDEAASADEAMRSLPAHAYDVILSDIQMPGMTGIQFLKAVRQIDLDVPVLLMTGAPTLESAIEAIEYGAFRYLPKPIAVGVLEEAVERAARYHAFASLKRDATSAAGGIDKLPAERAAIESRFEAGLSHLWIAFQPIVRCRDRRIHAFEALLRCDEPTLRRPESFIEAAERLGRLPDLGRAIRQATADRIPELPADARVFVNLHPQDLNDPNLIVDNPLEAFSSRVVLEITERASLHDVIALQTKVSELRNLGFSLAVDDLGAGYAGLTWMAQLEPEYVKLDMSLIRNIHVRPTLQKLVRSMAALCQDLGKQVIAEGVEQREEGDVLSQIGCDLLQGFLFAKPARTAPRVDWAAIGLGDVALTSGASDRTEE